MAPAIFVFPDCFTALGGNQYINSSAVGRYADYLDAGAHSLGRRRVPHPRLARAPRLLRQELGRLRRDRPRHEVLEVLGAIANHSGDAYFDFVYGADWPNTLDALAKFALPKRKEGPIDVPALAAAEGLAEGLDDGRVARFLKDLHGKRKLGKDDGNAVMNLCMAATYDPDPKAPNGFRLPYHLETGERIEKRWRRGSRTTRSTW